MQKIIVQIEYKDKKTSSGKFLDGIIYLRISNRISREEQNKHIVLLKQNILRKKSLSEKIQFDPPKTGTWDDESLRLLAEEINSAYYFLLLDDICFHKQSATWGTCSIRKKKIYISKRLLNAPEDLMRYIVTHELCHLAEPSHNKRFWQLVSRACPDHKNMRKRLKAYGYLTATPNI